MPHARNAVAGVTKLPDKVWFQVTHKGRYIGGDVDWHKAVAKKAEAAGQSLTKLLATAASRTGLAIEELRSMKSEPAVQWRAKCRSKYIHITTTWDCHAQCYYLKSLMFHCMKVMIT